MVPEAGVVKMRQEIQEGLVVIVFEASRRVMWGARTLAVGKAYGALIVMLKSMEVELMSPEELVKFGFFQWATNDEVGGMLAAIVRNTSSVRDAPMFNEVTQYDYASSMLSLRNVRNPKMFVTAALTYRQCAQIENEALYNEGRTDYIETEMDNLTVVQELQEAALYLNGPIFT